MSSRLRVGIVFALAFCLGFFGLYSARGYLGIFSSRVAPISPVPAKLLEKVSDFPTDPETGTVLLPTLALADGTQSSLGGKIDGVTVCDKLQQLIRCYLSKSPDLAKGYEIIADRVPEADKAPAVREYRCGEILTKLMQTEGHRLTAVKAGCVW